MKEQSFQDQIKSLCEWAEEYFSDDVSRFLQFCKRDCHECHEATDVVSYAEFLTLKEQFES